MWPVVFGSGMRAFAGTHAFEDADTASGLVCVDMKTDAETPNLDRLGSGVGHRVMTPRLTAR